MPDPLWQAGKIVLLDETVQEGELSYNWLMETVLVREADGRVRTFTANQVSRFSWFDADQNKQREFRTFAGFDPKRQNRSAFFEVCMNGSLAVVRRLRHPHGLLKHKFNHPTYFADKPTVAQNTDYFDYFVYDTGRLLAMDRFYNDIYLPLMTTYDRQLQQYAHMHQINDRSLLGRLVLISQYNWLTEQDAKDGVSPSGCQPL